MIRADYPRELFDRASKEAFSIPCDSPEQAKTLRQDLYNFRSNLNGEFSSISIKLHGKHLIIGLAEEVEHVWAKLP